jgi:guanylate kinase
VNNILVLTGYTASGKDTVLKELIKLGYKSITSYTTRAIRLTTIPPETNGIEYHFISEEEFGQKKKEGFFAETTSYETVRGIAQYGCSKEDVLRNPNGVIILNPDGLSQVKQKNINVTSFYLDVDQDTLIERLKKRGDNEEEYLRRLETDREDFENIHSEVDFIIDANNKTPRTIALEIISRVNDIGCNEFDKPLSINKPQYENVVYVAHKFQNDINNIKRVEDIINKLVELYRNYLFISPIHSFQFLYTKVDYQTGLDMCLFLLDKCDELWVFDEYSDSIGVNGEISFSKKYKIPIKYWDEDAIYEKLGL